MPVSTVAERAVSDIYLQERSKDRLATLKVQDDKIELLRQRTPSQVQGVSVESLRQRQPSQVRSLKEETVQEVSQGGHSHLHVTAAWSGRLRFSQYAFPRGNTNTWSTEQFGGYSKEEVGAAGATLVELSAEAQQGALEDAATETVAGETVPAGSEAKEAVSVGAAVDKAEQKVNHAGKALGHLKQTNWTSH